MFAFPQCRPRDAPKVISIACRDHAAHVTFLSADQCRPITVGCCPLPPPHPIIKRKRISPDTSLPSAPLAFVKRSTKASARISTITLQHRLLEISA